MQSFRAIASRRIRDLVTSAAIIMLVSACGPSDEPDAAPSPSGNPPASPSNNAAPTISGTPATTVVVGNPYSFQPIANDQDGDTLTFSITGKPQWASFATATGALTGTPAQASNSGSIIISVTDGKSAPVSLTAFTIAAVAASIPNLAPTITGAPPTIVTVGEDYTFTPTAFDANQDELTFSVGASLPSWASINTRTGEISGRPTSAGSHSNIVITVSDGRLSASLAPFTITVNAAPPSSNGTYVPYSYNLPTVRPFISLNHYNTGTTSSAFNRLKAQVDDVVNITNNISATATYDQLVSALNTGHYGYTCTDSVIMYRLTGDVKYIQQAIKMVDLWVISENARVAGGANNARIAADSYLEAGFFMEQLALVYDYGYSLLTPSQRSTWSAYAEQAIYNIWNPNNASWGGVPRTWTGCLFRTRATTTTTVS